VIRFVATFQSCRVQHLHDLQSRICAQFSRVIPANQQHVFDFHVLMSRDFLKRTELRAASNRAILCKHRAGASSTLHG
jgi:hypothetical protein